MCVCACVRALRLIQVQRRFPWKLICVRFIKKHLNSNLLEAVPCCDSFGVNFLALFKFFQGFYVVSRFTNPHGVTTNTVWIVCVFIVLKPVNSCKFNLYTSFIEAIKHNNILRFRFQRENSLLVSWFFLTPKCGILSTNASVYSSKTYVNRSHSVKIEVFCNAKTYRYVYDKYLPVEKASIPEVFNLELSNHETHSLAVIKPLEHMWLFSVTTPCCN